MTDQNGDAPVQQLRVTGFWENPRNLGNGWVEFNWFLVTNTDPPQVFGRGSITCRNWEVADAMKGVLAQMLQRTRPAITQIQ